MKLQNFNTAHAIAHLTGITCVFFHTCIENHMKGPDIQNPAISTKIDEYSEL